MSDIRIKALVLCLYLLASGSLAYSDETVAAMLVWVYAGLRDVAAALWAGK